MDADLPFENRRGGGRSTPSLESLHLSGVPPHNPGRPSPVGSHWQPVDSVGAHPVAKGALPRNESTFIEVTSGSIGKKRKSSTTAGLVEATALGTKALVESIDKIRDSTQVAEERRSKDLADVTEKQLEYFRCWDRKINKTQKGLVQVISSLLHIMERSFAAQQRTSATAAVVNDGASPCHGEEASVGEASGIHPLRDDDNCIAVPTGSVGTDSSDSAGSKSI
jgi:hypothetical protein